MSVKTEVDVNSIGSLEELQQLVADEKLTQDEVRHLFELNRLPKPVMVAIDREMGGHYEQPGLQDMLANTRYTGDIGAPSDDDQIIEDDVVVDESDNPPRSRGGRGRQQQSEE